jgi:anti-anti-sigma factor
VPNVTTTGGPSGGLAVTVSFDEGRAVLDVRGKLDHRSAAELGAVFDAAIVSGYLSVVLDVTELEQMDSEGLRVITYAATRLVASGGALTMRSPSPSTMTTRTLDITRLSRLVNLELQRVARDRLGPEQPDDDPRLDVIRAHASPARELRRITAIPADFDLVDGALRLVVNLARATVGGADGVSVSLRRYGRLATVAASDQTVSDMDANQYVTGEGPCVDASTEGRWFHAASLDTETRWPAFTPRAQALGINAILSSPLLAEDRPVGALNIYSRTTTAFAPKDQELASVFAAEASTILTDAGVDVTNDQLATRFGEAQRIRQIIALAQGVIMEHEGIDQDAAYTVLRNVSRRTNQPLRELAEYIVASTQRPRSHPEPKGGGDG